VEAPKPPNIATLISSIPVGELIRYGFVGLVNTALGYAIFLGFLWWAGLSTQVSNALGYGIGLSVAYVLYRYFVFKGATFSIRSATRFILCFVVAFALNQVALWLLTGKIHVRPELAQIVAMAIYTAVFYTMNKYIVWATKVGVWP
jgi:putative flippase GtrA